MSGDARRTPGAERPGAAPPPAALVRAEIERRLRETPMGLTVQAATEAAMGVVRPLLDAWAARVDELETAWERVRPGHHPDLERALRDPDGPCQDCIRLLFADLARDRDEARADLAGARRRLDVAQQTIAIKDDAIRALTAERDAARADLDHAHARATNLEADLHTIIRYLEDGATSDALHHARTALEDDGPAGGAPC